MSRWTTDEIPDLSQKNFVITGANSGIGYEAALVLAEKRAHVVLACRDIEKGERAAGSIKALVPGADLEVKALDLASLSSIRAFADWYKASHRRLECLVNNAGVMALPRSLTTDGFEMQIGTNHLGHFALTGCLLDCLNRSERARVVTVSSQVHRIGRIDFEDMMGERRYDEWVAYGNSKLANLLFSFELAKRLAQQMPNVKSVSCHPGYAATNLQRRGPEAEKSKVKTMFMAASNAIFAQTAAKGALPTLRAAADTAVTNGEYYGPSGPFESFGAPIVVRSSASARDAPTALRLWEVSESLTGVRYL